VYHYFDSCTFTSYGPKYNRYRVFRNRVTKEALFGLAVFLAAGCVVGFYLWGARVHRPPKPAAAMLPATARALLLPFRKDSLDLKVPAREELDYRVGMQAGATLVYAWSTQTWLTGAWARGQSGEMLLCECPGQKTIRAAKAHGAFLAQSSGWYHWRWKNESGNPITVHVKLSGYYEAASMPYDK
jgi:hypothetical protein